MIRNGNIAWHETEVARRPKQATARRRSESVLVDGVRPDPDGTLEERCAWMRLRQERRKERGARR